MSIIKNDDSIYHTNVTIMRLPKDVALSSPPLPTGHPLAGTYIVKKAIEINNTFYQMYWYSAGGETVRIKCELNENAEGVIYGHTNRRIIKVIDGTGNWIRWMNGDTVEAQVAWDNKIHVIGYQGSEEDWLNGGYCTPYYDGQLIAPSVHNTSYQMSYNPNLGALTNTITPISSSDTWAMRIYEAIAYSYYFSSYTYKVRYTYHVYAAQAVNGSLPCLIETRCKLQGSFRKMPASGEVHNVAINFGADEDGYGLQLDDVSFITGNKYHDLIACIADDGGIDTVSGWTEDTAEQPYKISNKDFAFYLPTIPVKNETGTRTTRPGYIEGELIKGRKPQWDMWNDSIKFGKYGSGNDNQLTTMKFNIFKENNGDDVISFEQLKFDGYNQANSFPPSFDWSGLVEMEFHNGVQCKIDTSNIIVGALHSSPEVSIYYPNFATGGDLGFVKLGNLPLWNYSTAEQDADLKLNKLRSYGGGLIIKADDYNNPQGWTRVGTLFGTTDETYVSPQGNTQPRPLSSDSNETTKLLKTQGVDCTGFFRRDSAIDFWRKRLIDVGVNALKMDMCLVKTTGNNPSDADIIDCSQMIASKDGVLKGLFDVGSKRSIRITGKHYHVEDRFLLGEENGVANINGTLYPIGVQLQQDISEYDWCETMISQNTPRPIPDCGFAIGFGFALKNGNDYLSLFTNDEPNVFGYAQVFEETKTEVDDDEDIVVEQKTIEIEEYEDIYTYNQYSLTKDGQLRDCDVQGDLDDFIKTVDAETGNVIFETSFVIQGANYPYYNSKSGEVRIDMMSYIHKAQQTTLYYDYEVTGNTEDITCTIKITFSRENNDTESKVTIDHCFYDCLDEDNEVHSITVTDRSISNRSYGFAKTVWNQYISPHTDYWAPFSSYNSEYWTSNVNPWNTSADRSQGKMGALFFMWQDLYTKAVAQNKRCNEVKRNDVPMTVWVRLFGTSSGPHAWDLYTGGNSVKGFDKSDECQTLTVSGHTYKFLTNDRLIENENHDFIDTYISIWSSSSQVTAASEWEGKTLRLYAVPLHEPKDGDASSYTRHWVAATESVDGHWEYDPIAEFAWDSTATSAGYVDSEVGARCEIKSNLTVYDYLSIGGHPQFEATGIYRLRIYPHLVNSHMLSNPSPGTMYYLSMY